MTEIAIPPEWMREAASAYDQYCVEWNHDEAERVAGSGEEVEPVQAWPDFFAEYLYAELENAALPVD